MALEKCLGGPVDGIPAVFLMGPTASGKSDVALALSRRFPVELVSVDASQVYRGLDVGTAKPDARTRSQVPHHLIDIREPTETYSAAAFARDAAIAVEAIASRRRIPLLVGGTMFYFRALEKGLSSLPGADDDVRGRLQALADRDGVAALHDRLAEIDPSMAGRIARRDFQRLQRALEIHELTGEQPSTIMAGNRHGQLVRPLAKLALTPSDRRVLHRRIEERFVDMCKHGLVDEVRDLEARGLLCASSTSARAVGYRQALDFVAGSISQSEMIAKATAATRQLAKRQITWLRAQAGVVWLDAGRADRATAASDYLAAKLAVLGL